MLRNINMKAILLAGGTGSRLYPTTMGVNKQLIPLYDKPMVYYPFSVAMLAGIREVLVISTAEDLPQFQKLLGAGARYGMRVEYAMQLKPDGLVQAFLIGEEYLGDASACLLLGDTFLYGNQLAQLLKKTIEEVEKYRQAAVFAYPVDHPERYGVVEFDESGNALSLEEKPDTPRGHHAVVGLYFYPTGVVEMAKRVRPSSRGELEITTLNRMYHEDERLRVNQLGRGFAWLDTGTAESMLQAGLFVGTLQQRQGLQIACLEEIAFKQGWIDRDTLRESAHLYRGSSYGDYLGKLAEGM